MDKTEITVETIVNAGLSEVWEKWTSPEDIMQWNHAGDDWVCPAARNNLAVGGVFSYTMASKDGKMSFDFTGTYTEITEHVSIQYILGDGREVRISFSDIGGKTKIVEIFDAEHENSIELQQAGWHAILENFRNHVERGQ